jgi:phosphatidylglycerol:prolipoprotein diacylglycerol transferase
MQTGLPFPNIDPVAIHIWGDFGIRWYALAYLAGILLGWRLCLRLAKRYASESNIRADKEVSHFSDFIGYAAIGIILGGRLGYVLLYNFSLYLQHPLRIFNLSEGGMSFHGGLAGVVVVTWLYCRANALPVLRFADMLTVAAPIGLFFGRIANFINAELWGRPTDLPWGVIFPIPSYLQDRYPEVARHPSQLYEAGLEGLLLFALTFSLFRVSGLRNRPGTLVGVFLAGYGSTRFLVEFVREPDAHLQFLFGWMTYGQLYSLPLIALGLVLIITRLQRAPEGKPATAPSGKGKTA